MAAIHMLLNPAPEPAPLPALQKLIIGTRDSKLALAQTEIVRRLLTQQHPYLVTEIIKIKTAGDKDTSKPIRDMANSKALWTQDLETMLLSGQMDLVVHSLKDMPTTLPQNCQIGAVLAREDPRDVLVMRSGHRYNHILELPKGSVIGTSSVRRMAQIRHHYPNLIIKDMRGNVLKRLEKLDNPDLGYDGLILAAAGLIRLNLQNRISHFFQAPKHLYAVGQGAIAVECRLGDNHILSLLKDINDGFTSLACFAERSMMRSLEGGCSAPIGVDTVWINPRALRMQAIICSLDGEERIYVDETAEVTDELTADRLGGWTAIKMEGLGARQLLASISKKQPILGN